MYYSNQVNNKAFSQKKFFLETQNRLFSPHHQITLSQSLNCESTSLVLAKYKLVVLRPLCACSIIFCCCLLLFPQCFYRCKLVLFHPATYLFCPCLFFVEEGMGSWASLIFFCLFSDFVSFLLHVFSASGLVLFLHTFPAMFVISFYLTFFSFTQFLLLTIPCFFLSYFFILVFIPMLLYKRILPSKGY